MNNRTKGLIFITMPILILIIGLIAVNNLLAIKIILTFIVSALSVACICYGIEIIYKDK